MGMEDLINECGGFGKYQILVIFGVYTHKLSIGWSMLQMSFAGFIPDWYCVLGSDMANSSYRTNDSLHQCSINNSHTGHHEQDCTSHHFEGDSVTAVTEWDLVCDRKWVKATMTSIQMAGVLVGAISCGQLADLFGRKKTTYGYSLFHALMNFGAAFSTSWEMFAAFRFLIGIGIGGLLVITLPYPMEFLPTKWRPLLAVLPVWSVGVCLFSVAALVLDNWSYVHIACGVLNIPALVGYFYVPESVRWLTLKGRYLEAEKIVEKMAIVNGRLPPKQTRSVLERVYKEEQESRNKGRQYTYWDLFKGRQQIINTLVFSYLWFTLSMVYYGISFGVSALSGNLYLNIFLLAVVELPPQFSTFYLNNKLGRKWTCIGLLTIGFLPACGCWIVYSVVHSDSRGGWITGLSLASKMGLGSGWAVVCTWVSESYPTVVRSLGYGVVNTMARVGGILAPFLIDLDNAPQVAYAIITSMVLLAILLSFLVPDTKGKLLADSINILSSSTSSTSSTSYSSSSTVSSSHSTYKNHTDGAIKMAIVDEINKGSKMDATTEYTHHDGANKSAKLCDHENGAEEKKSNKDTVPRETKYSVGNESNEIDDGNGSVIGISSNDTQKLSELKEINDSRSDEWKGPNYMGIEKNEDLAPNEHDNQGGSKGVVEPDSNDIVVHKF